MQFLERYSILILITFSILGLNFPTYFRWANNFILPLLMLIGICVGLTLTSAQFSNVWKNRKIILPIIIFKYSVIPFTTFLICHIFNFPISYTVGLVILTSCPAANTGNIMCYLAQGDTAFIIITTITGCFISPLVTPAIIYLLLHKIVIIHFIEIVKLIMLGITVPIFLGIIVKFYLTKYISRISSFIPITGLFSVSLILSGTLAKYSHEILNTSFSIPLLCSGLIIFFLALGFYFSMILNLKLKTSIATAYEVGTFDGVLGILLTLQIVDHSEILPVIIFAVLNLIIGAAASSLFTYEKFKGLEYEK